MEGPTNNTNKLRFVGSKHKLRVPNSGKNANIIKSITAANNHGFVIVGCDDATIKFIKTSQFLGVTQHQGHPTITNLEQFAFVIPLFFKPTLLTVSRQGSILFVSGRNEATSCPVIEVYDIDTRLSIARLELPGNYAGVGIIDYAWHPDYPIVALCSNHGHLIIASIDKQLKKIDILYSDTQYNALTCCWSPKGKNLAVGMTNGSLIRMEPTFKPDSFTIKEVDKSLLTFTNSKMTPEHQLIKLRWINKTFLMSVHSRVNDPNRRETIHSLITVKPGKPYILWSNVSFENPTIHNYIVHLVNLTSIVVSVSNATTEPAVIGADGEKSSELSDWSLLSIEDEAHRMELPLNSRHDETYAMGVALVFTDTPVILFHTSDGVICPFEVKSPEQITFSRPEVPNTAPAILNPTEPLNLAPRISNLASGIPNLAPGISNLAPEIQNLAPKVPILAPQISNTVSNTQNLAPEIQNLAAEIPNLTPEIEAIRKKMDMNCLALSVLEEVNYLRDQFEDIRESHQLHREALEAIKADIDALDLGILEDLYLVEVIKSRGKRKRSVDPAVTKKMETIKSSLKTLGQKLVDLNNHVDMSWELVRRSKTPGRRLNTLDVIYKTLATNQKVIRNLKHKVLPMVSEEQEIARPFEEIKKPIVRGQDQSTLAIFREFFASRDEVPVRRPYE